MATSTRTDTSYSATLLRLHALEEYVQAELAAIKAALADLEPGGGESPDLDRIFEITVGGAQSPPSGDPQAPTVFESSGISAHQFTWGFNSEIRSMLADGSMPPIIDIIGYGEPEFYASGRSIISMTFGDVEMYTGVVGELGLGSVAGLAFGDASFAAQLSADGTSIYQLTYGTAANAESLSASRSLYGLILGNSDNAASLSSFNNLFRLTFGNEDNPSSLGLRSIFQLSFQNDINAANMVASGTSLYEMIKACEIRLAAGGL